MSQKVPPLPEDPESKAMLQMLSQVVLLMRQKGLASLILFAVANDGSRVGGHHLTDRADFIVCRGGLAALADMLNEEERTRRADGQAPSGLVDPRGVSID